MDWLALLFVLELSHIPMGATTVNTPDAFMVQTYDNYSYGLVEGGLEFFDVFYFKAGIKTAMLKSTDKKTFYPFESTYLFEGGIVYKFIKLGYRHICLHPTVPNQYRVGTPMIEKNASYDEIFLRFEGRIEL